MTGKELLSKLTAMSSEQLDKDIRVLLCDTKYPTDDGDYDNAYYDYDTIVNCSFNDKDRVVEIFGYVE